MKLLKQHKNKLMVFGFLLVTLSSCKKYLEIPMPVDQLTTETAFKSRSGIDAVVNGMYNGFSASAIRDVYIKFTYYMSDEGVIEPIPGSEIGQIISASIVPANTQLILWSWFYRPIYRANEIIEKLPGVPASILPDSVKKRYIAAAKYVRAASHLTLVSSWGDVPLITATSVTENINKPRTPAAQVYEAIVKDLQDAAADLSASSAVTDSRYLLNKYQAQALLARVYLYLGRWAEAEAAATDVINNSSYQLVTGVNNVFKRGSRESILSLGSSGTGSLFDNRVVLGWLTLPFTSAQTTTSHCAIPASIMSTFEPGDQRAVSGNWVINLFGKQFANKYLHNQLATTTAIAANPQDYVFQRLAEVYLIRAEARAQQGNITGAGSAATDLNAIRTRAGLPNTTASTQPQMLSAIELERLHELFYEGHRWYDLKRTGRLDAVLGAVPYKAANYRPHYNLWPIAQSELITSPNLTQNPGY